MENVSANRILLKMCEEIFPEGVPDTRVDLSALFPASVDEAGSDKSGQIVKMVTNVSSETKGDYEGIDVDALELIQASASCWG